MDEQQRWNRYVRAINHCIRYGFNVDLVFSKGKNGKDNGNVMAIKVSHMDTPERKITIPLEPRKYRPQELLWIIINSYG